MVNKKLVLVYGFDLGEVNLMRGSLNQNNLPICKVIENNMGEIIVEDIINGVKSEEAQPNIEEDQRAVLFYNLTDNEINKAIGLIRSKFNKKKPLLAVVTPTSIKWKFNALIKELQEERKMFEDARK
ncbi:MAG: DUF3783 domain-containing protein [Clostridiaceae bacterium]